MEREASAAAILVKRMGEGLLPEAPVWSDLRTFDARPWRGKVEGVVAGYPCQPFSESTPNRRRAGHADERNLWPDVLRVVRDSGARWGFFENVTGHLAKGYFDRVRPDLEASGFDCEEQIAGAVDAGLPHQRNRLFILAVDHAYGEELRRLPMHAVIQRRPQRGNGSVGGAGDLACCPPRIPGPADDCAWRSLARSHPSIFPAREPSLRGDFDGVPASGDLTDRIRVSLLGNAVVPDQAALAWRLLWEAILCAPPKPSMR